MEMTAHKKGQKQIKQIIKLIKKHLVEESKFLWVRMEVSLGGLSFEFNGMNIRRVVMQKLNCRASVQRRSDI